MLNAILLGGGVGIALGLTGGGGVLAVPALMLGLGFTLPQAMPISLISVGIASFIGSLDGLRRGLVRYRAAIVMALCGTLFAPLGIWLSHNLPTTVLTLIFSLLLFMIALRMARQALKREALDAPDLMGKNCMLRPDTGRFQWNPRCFMTLSSIGGLSGLCSGMLGVGGGFLIVPGIRQFSNLNMHGIVATSLTVITLISIGTVTSALLGGARINEEAWWFIGSTCIGMLVGRQIAPHLPGRYLQLFFAILASIASLMLMKKHLLPLLLN